MKRSKFNTFTIFGGGITEKGGKHRGSLFSADFHERRSEA